MSSNERSLYQMNEIRFAKRLTSLRISSNQNLSLGELPFTTATVFVSGNTSQDILEDGREAMCDRDDGVIRSQIGILNATLLHRREHHGRVAKSCCRWRWTKATAGAPMLTIRSSGRLAWRARRYSTNGASGFSSLERAVKSECSVISSGHGDCRSSSARMVLAYSLQGLKSRPKE